MSPKLVCVCRMWRTFNHKNKNQFLGTSFLCIDIKVCANYLTIPKEKIPEQVIVLLFFF